MQNFWIGVAAENHLQRGKEGGFMQVNHGKEAPLRRLKPDDVIACYSPVATFGGKDKLMAFTAIGVVLPRPPYQADMGDGFTPYRRDVQWSESNNASIVPLLEVLNFTRGQKNWGYKFRFGLFEIGKEDMVLIAQVMNSTIRI
jgi:EVE domain